MKNKSHLSLVCNISELASLLSETKKIDTFLNQATVMVARHLNANVCSIYLYEEKTNDLVLKATIGLNIDAVGKIKMKPGEGLVGNTFENLNVIREGKVVDNPKFKYFYEAGEDNYQSFLSVPIQRGSKRLGVLVVEHIIPDYFDEIDSMALRAIASQLAGSIEYAKLLMDIGRDEEKPDIINIEKDPLIVKGTVASKGYAFGRLKVFQKGSAYLLSENVDYDSNFTLGDFYKAVEKTGNELKDFQEKFAERLPESASLIFTAHFMILKEDHFLDDMVKQIIDGLHPFEAVRTVANRYISIFSKSQNAYMREKSNDIEDLAGRILKNLKFPQNDEVQLSKESIIVAKELYPSDIMKLASQEVKGIILASGGITSHVAILARSLQIPLIIANHPELLKLPDDILAILDGETGNIYVSPPKDIITQFEKQQEIKEKASIFSLKMKPITETKDGIQVHLFANINLLTQLSLAKELMAEGIGLYRTEFPFLIRTTFPSEEEQHIIYKRLCNEMKEKEITIRTLDIGGEKALSYLDISSGQANPDLGLRGIRFSLQNKDIFYQQIRAILRAGHEVEKLSIMFPMISSLDEFREAKQSVIECMNQLKDAEIPYKDNPSIGMMVEVPSVIELIDEFAHEADFFSIGTNDFVQYMLAVDRANEKVASYYQPYHPSVLRGIAKIAEAGKKWNIGVSICGEMAHQLEYIPFLLGVGIRKLSIDPQFLPIVQKFIMDININDAQEKASKIIRESTTNGIKKLLNS
ncbi:MAG: phosphoenolpyruvate--protein phosphotransferase [Desulfobacterales bacterium]|nr:phosphoenolpyruvate--protein phosphotransferase [Desulfobacterales bacterium]